MSPVKRRVAGALLLLLPTVMVGGVSLLALLVNEPGYRENQLRQDLWRAGHAHAGVLLILALVTLRYLHEANLSPGLKRLARHAIPAAAVLLPVAFFLSVAAPDATAPNALIALAYLGAIVLGLGLLVLGVGLLRGGRIEPDTDDRGA